MDARGMMPPGDGPGAPLDRAGRAAALVVPLAVFCVAFVLLRDWVVDDAGITFAYARNAAAGHGLVSQPGQLPVEGYSNFLWLAALLPFFELRVFDATWTPKLVSLALVVGTFWLLGSLLPRRLRLSTTATVLALTLIAANPAFAIWTVSGLENALMAFLVALEWSLLAAWSDVTAPAPRLAVPLGLTASAIALTRPDGLLYCVAAPAILIVVGRARRAALRDAAAAFTVAAVVFAAFLVFRWTTFHDLFPNAYWAKGGPGARSAAELMTLAPDAAGAWIALHHAIGSKLAGWVAVFLVMVPLRAALGERRGRPGRLSRAQEATGLLYACTAAEFVLLPPDWMSEYRFATPFVLVSLPWLAWCTQDVFVAATSIYPRRRWAAAAAVALLAAAAFAVDARRMRAFRAHPTVSVDLVAKALARPYNDLAARLGLTQASLLAPDLGGLLMQSRLTVIDLVGLCDRTIARSIGKDQPRFYAYVFEERKPTFIHTHDYWTWLANLDADPRFRRDYEAIREYVDPDVERRFGRRMMSGDYVRKSALPAGRPMTPGDLRAILEVPED
ncbi:MAG TPA: hypothetical protein VGY48_05850 [Vicinamibacterales bacterium]|jgi:hypothetical protein|nr:hypothetical protein [Vicinamibacterales bacterium]